jgi:DNA-binding transcriptional MerR regulator
MATRSGASTIGQLARQAGVSVQTLRHYHRLGLLRPAATSAGGYRLYTDEDRGRLQLIRALRSLDLDLDTIGRLLRGTVGVKRVAELHLRALDLQARTLERRRAVLRVLLRSDASPTADRLARLQALAGFEQMEREQFLSEQLANRLRGARRSPLGDWLQRTAVADLPASPTEAQVEAWLELAEIVSDPAFLARHRDAKPMTFPGGGNRRDPKQWVKEMSSLYAPAARAAIAGVDPTSAKARPIVRRWVSAFARRSRRRNVRGFAERLLQAIEVDSDPREQRFWQLISVLKPDLARSPVSVAWPWLLAGLRAWLESEH